MTLVTGRSGFLARIFALQWLGDLGLLLLAAAWLQIPDSHTWQFVLSIVAAALILCGFVWLHTKTFRVVRRPAKFAPYVLSAVFLAVIVGVWLLLTHPIAAARLKEYEYAGYWNSRLPQSVRYHLTYLRIYEILGYLYDSLEVFLAALLLPLAAETMAAGISRNTLRNLGAVYGRWLFWVLALIAMPAATLLTELLIAWTPIHGMRGEIFSVVARLGFAYTFDVLLWCILVALIGRYLSASADKIS